MCGIFGYVGKKNCVPFLIEGLKKLEYRGYDSAGIAVLNDKEKIEMIKKEGRISTLEKNLGTINGRCGIGHTRWATHGKPSDENSHPHQSGKFVLVHNGIIENYLDLKIELVNSGVKFISQTDSEVIAHLCNREYKGNMLETISKITKLLKGSYALAIICEDYPNTIFVTKKDNPLIIGIGDKENYVSSDVLAIASHTNEAFILNDFEIAIVTNDSISIFDKNLKKFKKNHSKINVSNNDCGMGQNESYMLKEIKEIPKALKKTFDYYLTKEFDKNLLKILKKMSSINIVACGTAYHAGICGKYVVEELCRIPVSVNIASEFRYSSPIIDKKSLTIAISQSGETADTLAALKLAKASGSKTIAITNVPTSSITQIADFVLPMLAGPEIAVAATKSYNTQLAVLYMLALKIRELRKKIKLDKYIQCIKEIPLLAENMIKKASILNELAGKVSNVQNVFFLGRNLDYAVALEGSLKLKEISYIHSEGYPAGELKHGTLALIEKNIFVIVLITQKKLIEKSLNALHEVKAREANILLITGFEELKENSGADNMILIPKTLDLFMPILSVIPLQIFAYYMARAKGNDPDKPRNLAKSVTVE
ncbi:MAG: glutamine--fructose-6-phosphate transaminase (isomerizing) [Clostridia bacterium]